MNDRDSAIVRNRKRMKVTVMNDKYINYALSALGVLATAAQFVIDFGLPNPWNKAAIALTGALALYGIKPRKTIYRSDAVKVAAEQGAIVQPPPLQPVPLIPEPTEPKTRA